MVIMSISVNIAEGRKKLVSKMSRVSDSIRIGCRNFYVKNTQTNQDW